MREKVTKEMVDELSNATISKQRYDEILYSIDALVGDIWRVILSISKRTMTWWAFKNDVDLDNRGSTGGEFDPNTDGEWITIIGDSTRLNKDGYLYNDGFPTEFLWIEGWEKSSGELRVL